MKIQTILVAGFIILILSIIINYELVTNSLQETITVASPEIHCSTSLADIPKERSLPESRRPKSSIIHLWSGEASRRTDNFFLQNPKIEIALAYCKANLQWLNNSITNDFPGQSDIKMTILSKCGEEKHLPDFKLLPNVKEVEIVPLPNKGGCDLAHVHFINMYLARRENAKAAANTIVFLLKDTPRIPQTCHQEGNYRSIRDMFHLSSYGEFVCGIKLYSEASTYHDTSMLKSWSMDKYIRHLDSATSDGSNFNAGDYKNLGHFIDRELNYTLPNEITEVCYGGVFALPAERLFADKTLRGVFSHIESMLLNGAQMSVVEHFVERLWASWLGYPLSKTEMESIKCLTKEIRQHQGSYMGTLITDIDHIQKCL